MYALALLAVAWSVDIPVATYNIDKTMTVYKGIDITKVQNRIEIKQKIDKSGDLEIKISLVFKTPGLDSKPVKATSGIPTTANTQGYTYL
jgi:hypothetical protein